MVPITSFGTMATTAMRILLADDDRFFRKAAEAILVRSGFTVMTAADGDDAIDATRRELPDLVLLDLIMPKRNGFDALVALKADAATSAIPVVVLSTLGQESDVSRALEAGAADYVVKSQLPLKELVRRVQAVFDAAR